MEPVSATALAKGVFVVMVGAIAAHCVVKFSEGVSNAFGAENILDSAPRSIGYNIGSFFTTKEEEQQEEEKKQQQAA